MNASDKTPVAIALSGGTDSAAAAVMMKQSGLELLALTMLLSGGADGNDSSIRAAGAIAGRLGIRHRVLDLREQFEKLVIEPFFSAYSNGLTPNPCVTCNRELKAGLMLKAARDAGCESMATGHYAISSVESNGRVQVLRARDRTKDQSYVLWAVDRADIGRLVFPLGRKTRSEARDIVKGEGLDSLTVTESQDICFLAGGHYREAFVLHAPDALMPGPILDVDGRVLGSHRGLPLYTVGQRRGLGLGGARALYVLELRPEDNSIVVGGLEELACTRFEVAGVNFTADEPGTPFACGVMTRYRGAVLPAVVELAAGRRAYVRYGEPGPPAAPGQSAVFYNGDTLLGGGVIRSRLD